MSYNLTMRAYIDNLLKEEKIEYFRIIPFEKCRVINRALLDKSVGGWEPKSAVVFLVPYYCGEFEKRNVSLYAVGRDYHLYFKHLFERLEIALSVKFQKHFKGFSDHSPIGETYAAAISGLGIIGDSFQLINEKYGSHVFIGELLTDAEFDEYDDREAAFCTHCGKCREACPVNDGCLSEITQKKGELTESEKTLIINSKCAWGCDICRSACPLNDNIEHTPIEFFKTELMPFVRADEIEGMDSASFKERAYSWRGKNTILRNLKLLDT